MNSSRRLTPRSDTRRITSDEYGDDDIDDVDLLQAAAETVDRDLDFTHIDNFGHETASKTKKNTARNKRVAELSTVTDDWQPKKLDNGNWECNHKCKDKNVCKHMCCRDGLDKAPKAPKSSVVSSEKHSDAPRLTQKAKALAKGQTTLSLAGMKNSRASKSKAGSIVEQVDLTEEQGRRPASLSRVPPSLERLERLHTSVQKDRPSPVSGFARFNVVPSPESGRNHHLSFLPSTQTTKTSNYGESWLDSMEDLPELDSTRDAGTDGKSKFVAAAPLQDDDQDMELDEPISLATRNVDQDFGDTDSILDAAMVGLADSQDLQATQRISNMDLDNSLDELPMDDEFETLDWPSTPKNTQHKRVNAFPPSDSSLPPREQRQVATAVRHNPFVETSSLFFTASHSSKRATQTREPDNAAEPALKRVKRVTDAEPVEDSPMPATAPAFESPRSPSPTAKESSDGPKSTPADADDASKWLLREFGQYVDFV